MELKCERCMLDQGPNIEYRAGRSSPGAVRHWNVQDLGLLDPKLEAPFSSLA